MSVPPDSQDKLRRIEARLIGLRKNADGPMVPETFLTELNQVLDDLEVVGIPADEFRLPKSTPVEQEFGGGSVIDGPFFRVKLDAAIQYLSGKRA
ncbi:MAG TPA: hypothetical protein VGU71_21660 [Candidatus Dormibacteraeota bacterium]|nr:hypothetical protein [Candidatus Dormibacteraeota bacterium]